MSAQFSWNWENKFKPWELVEHLPSSKLVAVDPTTVVGSDRPVINDELARWMVNYTRLVHRQTILLPHAGCEPVLRSLRRLSFLDYWLVEEDEALYERVLNDDTVEQGAQHAESFIYDIDCIWNLDFDTWAEQFDPADTQADAVIICGPLYRAASDMATAWPFLKRHASMVAVLPVMDLFDKNENGKVLRNWCIKRDLTYGIPRPNLVLKSDMPVVVVFGEKHVD